MKFFILLFSCFFNYSATLFGQQKVIFINIRGASQVFVDSLLTNNTLSANGAFSLLKAKGSAAKYVVPVENAVTAVNNATIETGVPPSKHGIIANNFLNNSLPLSETQSGFVVPFAAETIWEAAARQNKKVIKIGTLQPDGSGYDKNHLIPTLAQSGPLSQSQLIISSLSKSFTIIFSGLSLIKELRINRDGNRYLIDEVNNKETKLIAKAEQGEWVILKLNNKSPVMNCRLKILSQKDNELNIYISPVFKTYGYPANFINEIDTHVGYYFGGPDYSGFLEGRITKEILKEQIAMETDYLVQVALYCIKNKEVDLLMLDHPALDRYGHYFYHNAKGWDNISGMAPGYVYTDNNLKKILTSPPILLLSLHRVMGFPMHIPAFL